MLDRDGAALSAIEQKLSAADHPYGAFQCELTDPVQCERAIQSAAQNFGKIDALINNAGVNDRVGLENGSPKHYVESLERNLFHYYNLAHFALPALKASNGSIVNVASKTAVTGEGGTSGYASAKGAVLALTREWAVELLPYQIRVNAVVPAEVMTPLYQQWLGTFPDPQKKTRLHRFPHPARLANDARGRNRFCCFVSAFRTGRPHHRSASLCRWRLRPS